jgi:flagellar motility protein MotE (MotC chaperone)
MRNKSSSLHHELEKMPGIGLSGLGSFMRSFGRNWNCRRRPEPLESRPESSQANLQESKNHINIKKEINVNRNMLQVNGKEMKGQEDNIAEKEESYRKEEGSRDKPVWCN